MRKRLASCLVQMAEADSRIFFLTGDLGFGVFDEFKEKFPKQYLNVGIAEAGMVTVASGMAAEGRIPIVYSIASFLVPKTFEQLRLLSSYNLSKIICIGAGGGFSYSMSGPSHHSLDDLALALMLPNFNVFAPSGPESLEACLNSAISSQVSSYIQIGKFGEPDIDVSKQSFSSEIGVISTGVISNESLGLVSELKNRGLKIDFLPLYSLSPLPELELIKFAKNKVKVVVIEEMLPPFSLYTLIMDFFNHRGFTFDFARIGPRKKVYDDNVERNNRLKDFGLSIDGFMSIIDNSGRSQ